MRGVWPRSTPRRVGSLIRAERGIGNSTRGIPAEGSRRGVRAGGPGSWSGAGTTHRRARREARARKTKSPRHRCAKEEMDRAAAGATTRSARRCGSGRAPGDRDAELPRLVDEVLGDAGDGERDHALRQEVEQFVVAPERGGAAVAVPVRLVDDPVDAVPVCPACRDLLDAGMHGGLCARHHRACGHHVGRPWCRPERSGHGTDPIASD